MRPLIFVASLLVVGLSLCLSPRAYGLHSGEFFVYRLEYPEGGASGPPNRICTGYRIMSVEVTTLPDMEAIHVHPGPDPGAGTGIAATHWMAPHSGAFTMPGSHQGDIQIDNPTSTPIAAFAIGVPQSSVAMPVAGYMQPEFGGGGGRRMAVGDAHALSVGPQCVDGAEHQRPGQPAGKPRGVAAGRGPDELDAARDGRTWRHV